MKCNEAESCSVKLLLAVVRQFCCTWMQLSFSENSFRKLQMLPTSSASLFNLNYYCYYLSPKYVLWPLLQLLRVETVRCNYCFRAILTFPHRFSQFRHRLLINPSDRNRQLYATFCFMISWIILITCCESKHKIINPHLWLKIIFTKQLPFVSDNSYWLRVLKLTHIVQ